MKNQVKIKLCGLRRPEDIDAANVLLPDYAGFVFAPKSKRYVPPHTAAALRSMLDPVITTVGVFVNEPPKDIALLLNRGIIGIAQLHGSEDEEYIRRLRALTDRPLIQAFRIDRPEDVSRAGQSSADHILLDAGTGGTGTVFNWDLIRPLRRPYFLAGGLHSGNVAEAISRLHPYAVDVSSGIETDGIKDADKMRRFVSAVRQTA